MRCGICRGGETHPGATTVTLERDGTMLVVKGVPARICENCAEAYVDEQTTARLLKAAEAAVLARVQVDVRDFAGV